MYIIILAFIFKVNFEGIYEIRGGFSLYDNRYSALKEIKRVDYNRNIYKIYKLEKGDYIIISGGFNIKIIPNKELNINEFNISNKIGVIKLSKDIKDGIYRLYNNGLYNNRIHIYNENYEQINHMEFGNNYYMLKAGYYIFGEINDISIEKVNFKSIKENEEKFILDEDIYI